MGLLRDIQADEKGTIVVIFGLTLVPLLIFVSMAIDMARANAAGQSLQAAIDSAALAGSRYRIMTREERAEVVHNYFAANWGPRKPGDDTPRPRLHVDIITNNNLLKVSVDANLDALFFPLPGIHPFQLHRESYVKIGHMRIVK